MRRVLLDTGVLVALLDRDERCHKKCVLSFQELRAECVTTEPVLTEAIYLLGPSIEAQQTCIDFVLKGGATLVPQSMDSLLRSSRLMKKYADTPMDFADATLVVLAEETGIREILTLDARGFNAYRIHGKTPFELFP